MTVRRTRKVLKVPKWDSLGMDHGTRVLELWSDLKTSRAARRQWAVGSPPRAKDDTPARANGSQVFSVRPPAG